MAVEDAKRRRGDLGERPGPEAVERDQASVERGRDGGRLEPCAGNAAAGGEVLTRCQPRGGALTADDLHDPTVGVVNYEGHLPTEAERTAVGDAERQDGGHCGIGRVT